MINSTKYYTHYKLTILVLDRITLVSTDTSPSQLQLNCLTEWAQGAQTVTIDGQPLMVSIILYLAKYGVSHLDNDAPRLQVCTCSCLDHLFWCCCHYKPWCRHSSYSSLWCQHQLRLCYSCHCGGRNNHCHPSCCGHSCCQEEGQTRVSPIAVDARI